MSQPPQNGWGQQPSGDPYGQSSPNGGYGDQGGYEDPSQPAYGQPFADAGYGQPSADPGYGQDPSFAPSFGEDATAQTGETGGNNTSKIAIFACIGCAVIVILALLIGGGIWLFSRDGGDTAGEDTQTTQEGGTDEGGTDEGSDGGGTDEGSDAGGADDATDEATDDAAASGDAGTRDNPVALGDPVTLNDGEGGTIEVTFGEVNWDATSTILEANSYNEEPAEGETYVTVPISVTYSGSGSFEPGATLAIEYVSNSGNSFDEAYVSHDNHAYDVGTLYDGGSGSWEVVLMVPSDQVQDGAFNVSVLWNFDDDPVWVAAS